MSPDEPKRYVIDGKTYELPDSKLDEYGRLKNEFHELIMSTECLPIPKGCLSNRSNESLRKAWREYRAKFRDLLVEADE